MCVTDVEDEPLVEPEECHRCGCGVDEFDQDDYHHDAWYCPRCGAAQ